MMQVKQREGGREGKFPSFPSPSPLFHFFGSGFISCAAKTENPVPRSFFAPKPNGNACYAQARRVSPAKRPSLKGARKDGLISKLTYQDPHNNTGHHHHKGGEQEHRPTIEENISHSYNLHILIHNSDKSNSW